jgi:hypothetical protein
VREVVDVLGGAGEVDELGGRGDLRVAGEALAQPVLDRLHVVVGRRLERLHALGIGEREPRGGLVEGIARGLREGGKGGECAFVGQRLQPLDLDAHPLADEGELAEVLLQRAGLRGIAPVERRKGGEGRGHFYHLNYTRRFPRSPCMKLVASKTSPYARKVRVILAEKKLAVRIPSGERVGSRRHASRISIPSARFRRWSPTKARRSSTRR